MYKIILLGIPALALSTSCVPQEAALATTDARKARADDRPARDGHVLLRHLALDAPAGLEPLPLSAVEGPASTAPVAAPPFATGPQMVDDASRATDCLTAAIYYEARSETLDGQRAVAQVVLNRVRDRAFPATVCGVVYQGSNRRTGCQFSFTCDGSMDRPREQPAWERARAVAVAALSGSVYAPVGSATYYHADSVLPWWASSLSRIRSVGAHIFYRWRDRMESALAFRQDYAGEEPRIASGTGAVPALASAQQITGIAVHYGAMVEVQSGVTVHHGTPSAAQPSAAQPSTERPSAGQPPASTFVGVRVHFGVPRSESAATPIPAAASDAGVIT